MINMTEKDLEELEVFRKNKHKIIQLLKLGADYAGYEGRSNDESLFRTLVKDIENNTVSTIKLSHYMEELR